MRRCDDHRPHLRRRESVDEQPTVVERNPDRLEGRALSFSQDNLSWVVNAYALTFGGFLLLGGRLADLLGRRRVFIGGLVLFAAASLAGGFAESEGALIAARALQGLGAAILSPTALSIVTTTFRDGAERNKALGAWRGWRGRRRRGRPARRRAHRVRRLGVDPLGQRADRRRGCPGGSAPDRREPVGVGPPLVRPRGGALRHRRPRRPRLRARGGARGRLGSGRTIGLLAAAVALLGAFAAIELRSRAPLVPFGIFRLRTLTGANVVGILTGASMLSMFFFISLYMQNVLGFSAIEAGLSYLPLGFTIILAAGIASQLVTKVGYKPVLATGCC